MPAPGLMPRCRRRPDVEHHDGGDDGADHRCHGLAVHGAQRQAQPGPAADAGGDVRGRLCRRLAGYSALAGIRQVALSRAALLTPMLQSASLALSAAILLAAGIFQFTALKDACLAKCRTPLGFFMAEWRDGSPGAFAWACGTAATASAAVGR